MSALDELMTVDEVATACRVSRKTLDAWRKDKYGPDWVPMGKRRILYARSAVEHFIAQQAKSVARN